VGETVDTTLIQAQWDQLVDLFEAITQGTPPNPAMALSALSALFADAGWQHHTSNTMSAQQALAVIPMARDNGLKNSALVHLNRFDSEDAVFGVDGQPCALDTDTGIADLPSLDGYVINSSHYTASHKSMAAMMFNEFSQGGPPATAPNMVSDPIAAGAASGEALILCDVTDKSVNTADYRVVTTTSRGLILPEGLEALSPVYTIASNLPLRESFTPTLLIVNVQGDQTDAARTRVCLLKDDGTYTALPTYIAPNAAYGAAPLTAAEVPTLISADTGPEPGPRGEYIARFVLARK
jgi:hypothetical protein